MKDNQKKLLILGGGSNQVPLIEASKNMGYFTFVCDARDSIEGVLLADEHVSLDYMDRDAVLRVAKEKNIDGIISNSEPAMLNVAYISQELGLPGNSIESIETLLSKEKFRKLQGSIDGIYSPEHFIIASLDELFEKLEVMNYPVIIKPTECSGTRGTTRIDSFDHSLITETYSMCKEFSRNNLVSIEEYVEMRSLRVNDADVFVVDDGILWDGTLWEDRSPDAPMLPMTEIFPMALPDRDFVQIKDAVNKILMEAGVKHGEFNVETYFTTNHEVFVIEINPRQAGNYIPQLIKEHTGVDLTKLLVSTAVGDMTYFDELKSFERENNFITCQVVFAKSDGIYQGLYIDPQVKKYVQWIKEEYAFGDKVEKGVNAANAVAFVDLRFDNYETQHKFTDEIEKYVYAKILK